MNTLISGINIDGKKTLAIPAACSVNETASQKKEYRQQVNEKSDTSNAESLKQMLENIESYLQAMDINLSFSTYGKNNQEISVIVSDKETGEVIREIPPRELQNLYSKFGELIGIIFNGSA